MSATSSLPDQRLAGKLAARRNRRRFSPWLLLPLLLALIGAGIVWQFTRSSSGSATTATATVSRGPLSITVSGSGTVQPATTRTLAFSISGTVAEVLVETGDSVTAGQPLATLDPNELKLALQQAEANLKSAQANLAAAMGEGTTPQDIAAAEIQLRSAEAQLKKTRTGDVTAADLAGAQAQLESAQAKLDELLAGPTADTLSSARARLEQARLALEAQRTSLSTAKVKAESAMTTTANSLRDAQDAYSTLYWQNREREKAPGELPQANRDEEAAALRIVQNAEEAYRQAQLSYEQARQAEITGVQQAESDLRDAGEQLRTVEAGATEAEIASARASLASAKASLASLREGVKPEDITIAQASVEQARLNLEQLTSPGSAASIASADANLAQARVAYESAKLNLERATLLAPFAGLVSEVAVNPGDSAGASTTIVVIDVSSFYVELSLSESDTGKVTVGQPVTLSFDALPDVELEGKVERIAPTATVTQNVATYLVRISFSPGDAAVRAGMSATGAILVDQRTDALLVPSRAIQSQGNAQLVQVRPGAGQAPVPVRVQTGLSSGGQTEILSCVDTGNLCLKEGDELLIVTNTTTTTNSRSNNFGPGGPGGVPFR